MRIRGAKTLRRALWQLRGRLLGGDLVLGYHRVADSADDPWNLCVSPEAFLGQMRVLSREFRPTTLTEITERAPGSSPGLRVAVTFDDGYTDVMQRGLPILEETGVPATVFVVEEGLSGHFWWDRLAALTRDESVLPDELRLERGSVAVHWTGEREAGQLYPSLYAALRRASAADRNEALEDIQRWSGLGSASSPPVLTPEEVRAMDRHELVEIGSHGASHQELRGLEPATLREEIAGSAEGLASLLDRPIESFSYPHGIHDASSREAVVESGYRRACASWNGLVHAGTDPFRLPRLWPSNLSPERFRAWLRSWTGR